MKYIYYPGCSASGTGRAYDESVIEIFKALGIAMEELKDWNCCGATAYLAVDEAKAFALSARNLALAEDQYPDEKEIHIVAPCSACYMGLLKAKHYTESDPKIGGKIKRALAAADLKYTGKCEVRNPLDILANDFGLDKLKERTVKPLEGLKVAAYYGCQIVRPYSEFDMRYDPQTMDQILKAMGATPIEWTCKTRCCGGMLTWSTSAGKELNYILIKEAERAGADVIATACPLCQFNLECFQDKIKAKYGLEKEVPVAYFTQLMGIALGIDEVKLGMRRLFVPPKIPAKV
jgi:heterodisulfide reductase subunit B